MCQTDVSSATCCQFEIELNYRSVQTYIAPLVATHAHNRGDDIAQVIEGATSLLHVVSVKTFRAAFKYSRCLLFISNNLPNK